MIGNDCLLGQVATLMDSLHLTYDEVFDGIPYRNLIIMSKDKLHLATGDVVKRTSGKEMMERRAGKRGGRVER